MKRLITILFIIQWVFAVYAQYTTSDDIIYKGDRDERCIDMMGVPLEGPDSVFVPALKSIGLEQFTPEEPDPGDYYFRGEFYGGIPCHPHLSPARHTRRRGWISRL